jgi:hypothetical protein
MNWEDRVTDKEYEIIKAALKQLKRRKLHPDDCYSILTRNGMKPEEASEIIGH